MQVLVSLINKYYTHFSKILAKNKLIYANIYWIIGEKFFRLPISFIVAVFTAKYLGPAEFGFFNYAFNLVWLFENLVTVGTNEILVRDIIKNPERRNELLGSAFFLRTLGGLLSLIVIYLYLIQSGETASKTLLVGLMAISMVVRNTGVIRFYYESHLLNKFVIIAEIISLFLISGFKIWCIYSGKPLSYFFSAAIAEVAIASLIIILFYQFGKESIFKWVIRRTTVIRLFKESYLLIFTGFFIMLIIRSGQVMLKDLASETEVGIYGAATRISDLYIFVPVSIITSYFPAIIRKRNNLELYKRSLQKLIDIITLISFTFSIVLTLFSHSIIIHLFGKEYADSNMVMKILAWSSFLLTLYVFSSRYLIIEGTQKIQLIRSIVGALATLLLNLFLIPIWGATGAAIAVVSGMFITLLVTGIFKKGKSIMRLIIVSLNLPQTLIRVIKNRS